MSVQLIAVKCPACGADINVESAREFSFCTYCGTKIMMANENEHIYRNIDEARIMEVEAEKMFRLREFEIEEKENSRGRKSLYIAYGVALIFVIAGAIICLTNSEAGAVGIMIGAYIAFFTYIKSDEKKKTKRKYVGPNEVAITESMGDYSEKNFNSVVLLFRGAGFANVTAIPLGDLTMFNQRKNGQVESITINGRDEFEPGDIFPKNSNVLITYHSK